VGTNNLGERRTGDTTRSYHDLLDGEIENDDEGNQGLNGGFVDGALLILRSPNPKSERGKKPGWPILRDSHKKDMKKSLGKMTRGSPISREGVRRGKRDQWGWDLYSLRIR